MAPLRDTHTSARRIRHGVGLALTVLGIGGMALDTAAQRGNADAAKLKNPVEVTPASVEAGQKVYQRYCRGCHGTKGEGGPPPEVGPPPSNLTDGAWDHGSTDGEIFTVIKSGVAPDLAMEAWGDRIGDQDIWNLVHYLRTLGLK